MNKKLLTISALTLSINIFADLAGSSLQTLTTPPEVVAPGSKIIRVPADAKLNDLARIPSSTDNTDSTGSVEQESNVPDAIEDEPQQILPISNEQSHSQAVKRCLTQLNRFGLHDPDLTIIPDAGSIIETDKTDANNRFTVYYENGFVEINPDKGGSTTCGNNQKGDQFRAKVAQSMDFPVRNSRKIVDRLKTSGEWINLNDMLNACEPMSKSYKLNHYYTRLHAWVTQNFGLIPIQGSPNGVVAPRIGH